MTEHHHVRLRYVVTCDECGDIGEVGTIGEGVTMAETHEALGTVPLVQESQS